MDPDLPGEFELIRRIRSRIGCPGGSIAQGIGDDTAVLSSAGDRDLLLTSDALVEGVHFRKSYTPMESLGWKALAVNLSDVAAMGGTPLACVVTLGISEGWKTSDVDEVYEGLIRCSVFGECPVSGGDTVRTKGAGFIDVTVLGMAEKGKAKLRSGARPGDRIWITGKPGGARTGLEVLENEVPEEEFIDSVNRFLEPRPPVKFAPLLAGCSGIHAMIDISDGIASDLIHVCEESGMGCELWRENIRPTEETMLWCSREGDKDPVEFALAGGEEYMLLFTADPVEIGEDFLRSIGATEEISCIGCITEQNQRVMISNCNRRETLKPSGWDHLKS
jgi:thiamine-monophosphate kinase